MVNLDDISSSKFISNMAGVEAREKECHIH